MAAPRRSQIARPTTMTIIERPWGSLLKLTLLSLNENQLRRELPSELGNLANLRSLALHENQLSGEVTAGVE